MARHKVYQRYFKKFSSADNVRIFTELFLWFFQQIHFDRFTLDLDSTILTRYGEQEGAKRGYNPIKRGRNSHHPLVAFISEVRMVVNFWLRSGDSYTTNNFYAFLENTFERLAGKTIGLLRADSGFFDQKILNYLEKRLQPISYIIAVRFYQPIKKTIVRQQQFIHVAEGIEIGETLYQANGWEHPRRLIIVRQTITKRPKAIGKQLRLFPDELLYRHYRYSCFVTNLTLPAESVWALYRMRADAENRIKEVKEDFGVASFNVQEFYATEATLNFVMMAYNLMSLFRQVILRQSSVQPQLKTLRYKVFSIGSFITKHGNDHILKLALVMKRRHWFDGLWATSQSFSWPFIVSTHIP